MKVLWIIVAIIAGVAALCGVSAFYVERRVDAGKTGADDMVMVGILGGLGVFLAGVDVLLIVLVAIVRALFTG